MTSSILAHEQVVVRRGERSDLPLFIQSAAEGVAPLTVAVRNAKKRMIANGESS